MLLADCCPKRTKNDGVLNRCIARLHSISKNEKKTMSDINKNIVLITKYHSFGSHKTSKQRIYEA